VLAFTDDDCQPKPDWLKNSIKYFANNDVVGIEGLIVSDKLKDDNYRPVTNVGFEGIGFMTANLMVRREVFMAVDGFDEAFENPHFREDTDLGWRISQYGQIPFAHDVCVFHPPHLRTDKRESLEERNRFFEKDALLMKKHPVRYRELFLKESHYKNTSGFRENFLRGVKKYNIELDSFYLFFLQKDIS
jgi:GT2 family glycosyltransferase